jgi:transcriptional regulator with XRE-family HTH domain
MHEIGRKIKQLRQQRNLALKELAAKTNLTPSFLSQLENGMTSPSIESLAKIAAVLDTAVGYFFQSQEAREFVFIKRQQKTSPFSADPIKQYEILASNVLDIQMLPMVLRLKKHDHVAADVCPQGEELLCVCLSGKAVVLVNDKDFQLEPLDSMYLVHPRFQEIRNPGVEEASLLWIVLRQKRF